MVDLNAPVWKTLDSAGCDDHVQWLRRLLSGEKPFRKTMAIFAEGLSHQLSWYSATSYTLPHLATLFERLGLEDRAFLIGQIGPAVAAESDCPLVPDSEAWREFHEGLEVLRSGTRDLIQNHMDVLTGAHYEERQMFALGALAVLGNRRHAYDIYLLSGYCWVEGQATCECGWSEDFLPLADEPDCLKPVEFARWDKHSLEDERTWFNGLLTRFGDEEILPILPLLYGTGICPECGKQEPYWTWLDRYMEEC